MAKRYAPMDARTTFCEGKTLTASDVVSDGTNDIILDVGPGRQDFTFAVNVTSLDIASADEHYQFVLQGSNSSTFASGIENLAILDLGATASRLGGAIDSVAGRYLVEASNQAGATEYEYVRLNVLIAGTTPTITFDAWLSIDE